MENEKNKCKKCGSEMKKSGPYLHVKEEGQSVHKGPSSAYYSCTNNKCEDYGKVIEVKE
jgi:hypothetical protein